ncbi:MAG: asparagine synthase-related protein [Caldimicrobium sp.]|nr:asparagine synthase-related protein [Caldimicrobium sp.]MDW8181980.1 asparagine synthase-related protein [Caldimicrobium sp.]
MVEKLNLKEKRICSITGPISFEGYIYLYISPSKDYILTSTSLKELLDHPLVLKPLTPSNRAISFYLQSGVIPTPQTIYEEILVLGLGDTITIQKLLNNEIKISFDHYFPFHSSLRTNESKFDEKYVLDLLKIEVEKRIKENNPIYIFQSLGKDSNTIVLALATSYLKEQITCLTLATGDKRDESVVAEKISQKLGFNHKKLYIPTQITPEIERLFDYYFEKITHPCPDGTSLAYPLYTLEIDFKDTYVIDGSGNDVYFGHVPRPIEYKRQKLYTLFNKLRVIAERLATGNPLQSLTKTKAEWVGMTGLSYLDAKKLYPQTIKTHPYWEKESLKRKNWDYFDVKADIWGTHVEYGNVIRKVLNFAEVFGATLILPWASPEIAMYVGRLSEKTLLDRKTFRNKIPLRELLKKHLELDSDKLGKYSYGFDVYAFLLKMENKVREEILSCTLWNTREAERLYKFLKSKDNKKLFRNILIRLFMLSAWHNHNYYLKRV